MFDLLKTAALWVADFVLDDDDKNPLDSKYSDFAPKKSSKSSYCLRNSKEISIGEVVRQRFIKSICIRTKLFQ